MGFASLWFPEHSHIPTARTTPWGGREGAPPLPDFYWRTHDQFVALGAVAATTERIRLGTGICLVAQRDPIWTAKEVASVDRTVRSGRFRFGIGYGWNVEEMEDHGVAYGTRRARTPREHPGHEAAVDRGRGERSRVSRSLSPSWAWPKPTQQPHPPVILGGAAGPKTAAHIAEFCDGWMPIGGRYPFEAGWDNRSWPPVRPSTVTPSELWLGVFGCQARPRGARQARADQGVVEAVFALPQGPRDEVVGRAGEAGAAARPLEEEFQGPVGCRCQNEQVARGRRHRPGPWLLASGLEPVSAWSISR